MSTHTAKPDPPRTIGIPRALFYYYHPGLWEAFLQGLGLDIVLSQPTSQATVHRASAISEGEHCLPVKLLDAHIEELIGRVDAIFVPRLLSTMRGHLSCPKLGALPDSARATHGERCPIISIDIDVAHRPIEDSLTMLGQSLGKGKREAKAAAQAALAATQKPPVVPAVDAPVPPGGQLCLIAHPYNLLDPFIAQPILRKLKTLGVAVTPISFGVQSLPPSFIGWDTSHKMHHWLEDLPTGRYLGVVHISSFNCGCDSMMLEFLREAAAAKGLPYLLLVIDEHTAQGGIDTRLEAFMDSLEVGPMTSLAIPNLGNYSIALAALGDCLGVDAWTSTCTSPEIIALGAEAAPESICLPFKMYTGHFIKAAREGVEYAVMVNSVGFCRLRYYVHLQRKILAEQGYTIHLFGLGYDGYKPPLFRHFDPKKRDFIASLGRMWHKLQAVDSIELTAWRCRARELRRGSTSAVMEQSLKDLHQSRTVPEIKAFRRSIAERFSTIALDTDRRPLTIGLLGEAAVLRDKFLNHNVEETLGGMGAEVRNFFLLGADAMNIFHFGLGNKFSKKNQLKLARPYLQTIVGGHALDSVANAIRCHQEGFDGVVHLCPSGCMPEISVRPILRKVSRDLDFPILELSFDEHTSHVGVTTRLEAFCDILWERRRGRAPRLAGVEPLVGGMP